MKLTVALIASLVTGAFASRLTATAPKEIRVTEVKADSKLGMDLLSKSRILEDQNQNGDDQQEQGDTWIAGMALKFQGCHHVVQWNTEAEDEEDMRVETKRLARFRLCPVSSCSNNLAGGCNTGYGDYIVDLDDFLASYVEAKQEEEEDACETYREYNCDCEDGDDKDDAFDSDVCEYQCFQDAGMNECINYYQDNNNNNNNNNGEENDDQEQQDQIDISDYTTCAAYEGVEGNYYYDNGNQNNNNRNNNNYWNNNNNNNEEQENEQNGDDNENYDGDYYIGPYCSDDGGGVVLGMFTDEFCTAFADQYGGVRAFNAISGGQTLPNSSSTDSIVDFNCKSCQQVEEEEGEERRLEDNGAEAKEVCTNMYEVAGKCEENLFGYNSDQTSTSNSCSYIDAIKEMGKTGWFANRQATPHSIASTFIGISGALCVGLGGYVHYLKQKLDRGSIDLHSSGTLV